MSTLANVFAVLRSCMGWLTLGCLLGAGFGYVYHHHVWLPQLEDLPRGPEQAVFLTKLAVRRILIGSLVGLAIGVLADKAVSRKRLRRGIGRHITNYGDKEKRGKLGE